MSDENKIPIRTLSLDAAAEELGVSRRTIYNMIRENRLTSKPIMVDGVVKGQRIVRDDLFAARLSGR